MTKLCTEFLGQYMRDAGEILATHAGQFVGRNTEAPAWTSVDSLRKTRVILGDATVVEEDVPEVILMDPSLRQKQEPAKSEKSNR
jgi:hypothetical protein